MKFIERNYLFPFFPCITCEPENYFPFAILFPTAAKFPWAYGFQQQIYSLISGIFPSSLVIQRRAVGVFDGFD